MKTTLFRHPLFTKTITWSAFLTVSVLLSLVYINHIVHAERGQSSLQPRLTQNTSITLPESNPYFQLETQTLTATSTPTSTTTELAFPTPTPTLTPSPTTTSTNDFEVTNTPTLLPPPTSTATLTGTTQMMIYGAIIANHFFVEPTEFEIEDYLICDSLISPLNIPDNDPHGVDDSISVVKDDLIVDVEIYLNADHSWIGDLEISLSLDNTEYNAILIDRPGVPMSNHGCGLDNLRTILDDQAIQTAENKCLNYPAAIAGIYQPYSSLTVFRGIPATGEWILNVSDHSLEDSGHVNKWCLHFSLSSQIPQPTPTPLPINLPDSARIYGISGKDQSLPLDCESRSAVDWANYFGVNIGEFEFLDNLPISDNPDLGFVGDVNGVWGQIPPNDYGVHADPVARLLNDYGLNAKAQKSLSWDEIRREISEDRPVIVWIIGSIVNGAPNYYTSQSSPKTSIVARYEHTVLIIGYTPESVIILDGDDIYTRPLNLFLESWSALNNMAVFMETQEEYINK